VTPTPNPPPATQDAATGVPTTTATTATTSAPAPTSATPTTTGGLTTVFLSGAVIAAVIAAFVGAMVNIALARRKSLEEERARVRTTFAEALQVVAEYKEFPYAIRRRRGDAAAAEERIRLSEALREVQAKLSYYTAWTKAESDEVGRTYETLVSELRKVAGKACHEAWLAPPANDDKDMNFPPGVVDLSALKPYEDAFVTAAHKHLEDMIRLRRLLRRA
jgi:hypothetical protein